jgi:hypothetical protein
VSFVSQQFPELNVKLVVTQEGKSEGTLSVWRFRGWPMEVLSFIPLPVKPGSIPDAAEKAKGWQAHSTHFRTICLVRTPGICKTRKNKLWGRSDFTKTVCHYRNKKSSGKFKAVPYRPPPAQKTTNTLVVSVIALDNKQINLYNRQLAKLCHRS